MLEYEPTEQDYAELAEIWPDVAPTEEELEAAHRAHLASVEAELTKTRDLLTDDDRMAAFRRLRRARTV